MGDASAALVKVVYVCHETVIYILKKLRLFLLLWFEWNKSSYFRCGAELCLHIIKNFKPAGIKLRWLVELAHDPLPPSPRSPRPNTSFRIQSVPDHYILPFYPVHSVSPINALHQSNLHNRFNNALLSKCSLANVVGRSAFPVLMNYANSMQIRCCYYCVLCRL